MTTAIILLVLAYKLGYHAGRRSRWEETMKVFDNSGRQIGRLDVSMSNDKTVTVHELRNITTITVRDRNTGRVTTDTLIGESPFGK
jgi:hypothetical protein